MRNVKNVLHTLDHFRNTVPLLKVETEAKTSLHSYIIVQHCPELHHSNDLMSAILLRIPCIDWTQKIYYPIRRRPLEVSPYDWRLRLTDNKLAKLSWKMKIYYLLNFNELTMHREFPVLKVLCFCSDINLLFPWINHFQIKETLN